MSFQKTLDKYQKRDIIIINKEQRTGDKQNGYYEENDYTWLYEVGYQLSFCSHLQQNRIEEEDYTQGASRNETGIEKEL